MDTRPPVDIVVATRADQIAQARELFAEYASLLGVDLDFQDFEAELFRQRSCLRLIAIGDHQHLRPDIGDIRRLEAMRDRDREDAVPALHRQEPVDEAAAGLAAGHEGGEPAAIEHRAHRLHLLARGLQAELQQILRPRQEVGMRELLEGDDDVGTLDHLCGEMAVHVELDTDDAIGPGERPRPSDQVAFAIIVTLRHHGAVQSEQHDVDRQRPPELP